VSTTNLARLGKGLEALIPKTYLASGKTVINIPIQEIKANPNQPRKIFKDEAMQALVESVKHQGVAQPILVRRIGNHYEVIAGERRFRASVMAGLETVPAIIRNMTDRESLQMALIENLQREDLNPIECAKGYVRLIDDYQLTHQELSHLFGKSRSAITNSIRLLNLPESIQAFIMEGALSEGHARTLLSLKDESEMLKFVELIKADQLSVREIEARVSKNINLQDNPKKHALVNERFVSLAQELSQQHQVQFQIKGKSNKGKFEIQFDSEEEFNLIYAILKGW